MHRTGLMGAVAALALLWGFAANAEIFDLGKYPDWSGQWDRADPGPPRYDPSKPPGRGQQAPLTAEYQANFEANLADQAAGGQGNDTTYRCIPLGMPRQMTGVSPMEFVIAPQAVYILYESQMAGPRRIYTDGRPWPADPTPSFMGYSIGKWIDEDGDGRYDLLEVETRDLKGPRAFDASGIPLHADNQTIVKERIYLDKANANVLHDEVTTIDHALTRPWTVLKSYDRVPNPIWIEAICAESNQLVRIGSEIYMFSADGRLMPAKKNQPPPDLKYFNQSRK